MKTSEFKRELNKKQIRLSHTKNHYVDDYFVADNSYKDSGLGPSWFAKIDGKIVGNVVYRWECLYEGLYNGFQNDIFNLINEYAATPIKEREDEKRYYIHVIKFADGYLNLNKNNYDTDYILSTSDVTEHYKTIFTKSEIEEMKRNPNLAIDWDKALEPVEEDEK